MKCLLFCFAKDTCYKCNIVHCIFSVFFYIPDIALLTHLYANVII